LRENRLCGGSALSYFRTVESDFEKAELCAELAGARVPGLDPMMVLVLGRG